MTHSIILNNTIGFSSSKKDHDVEHTQEATMRPLEIYFDLHNNQKNQKYIDLKSESNQYENLTHSQILVLYQYLYFVNAL